MAGSSEITRSNADGAVDGLVREFMDMLGDGEARLLYITHACIHASPNPFALQYIKQ